MSSTKAPFQTQSAVAGDRRSQRRRIAKPERPSRRRDLRGLWRTTLALIAPLPGLLMAAKIIVSPFGCAMTWPMCWQACPAIRPASSWHSGSA